jgi:hypothetical protein
MAPAMRIKVWLIEIESLRKKNTSFSGDAGKNINFYRPTWHTFLYHHHTKHIHGTTHFCWVPFDCFSLLPSHCTTGNLLNFYW